ncbi:MAG: peptidase M48 [Candidatus Methanomethylicota archaeon]|uniref:Peptidase M48 n=1 Tax=Thermoproteota archaeon TaxID=2056631 RepID=A0A497EYU4_9CREN|nr:MAG: peptidase M48 [Candidatus Verstraetearchaeota archaeon]
MGASSRVRLCFPGLSAKDFQHPADVKALEAVKKVKGFDWLTKQIMNLGLERIIRMQLLADSLKVSEEQCPSLWRIYKECCEVLDIDPPPDFFVERNPWPNAYTTGFTMPVVVITSGLLEVLDEDELRFILGHELGHYKCGHVLYMTMALYLSQILATIGQMTLGIGRLLGTGLELALLAWSRRAEFSADRAGLLAAQNDNVAIRALMKLAAPVEKIWKEVSVEAILRQAEEFEMLSEDKLSKLYKIFYGVQLTHPWLILRTKEVKNWIESDQYKSILESGVPLGEGRKKRRKKPAKALNVCPECGAEVEPTDRFCSNCGFKLR